MILPERVFGSSSVKMIIFGLAVGPDLPGDVAAELLAQLRVVSLLGFGTVLLVLNPGASAVTVSVRRRLKPLT